MKLIIYPLLSTRSRRAIVKTNKKWGWLYQYNPRQILIDRLILELGWTETQVREQIYKERKFLISLFII